MAAHERVYGAPYPARIVVDVTPYGGRFSGYTNDLTFAHTVISSPIQFYTTGELTDRVLAARGVDRFVPFVDKGLWEHAFRGLRDSIVQHWRPYLDGQGTRAAAIRAIVEETATSR